MTISLYLTMDDIAPALDQEPAEFLGLLSLLADNTPDEIEDLCRQTAEAHSGSLADERVLPFLRQLVTEFERVEASYT